MQRDINNCITRKSRPRKVSHVHNHHAISNNCYDCLEFFCVIVISILISFGDHRCLLPALSFFILFSLSLSAIANGNHFRRSFHYDYEIWVNVECFVCQVRFLFSYSRGCCCRRFLRPFDFNPQFLLLSLMSYFCLEFSHTIFHPLQFIFFIHTFRCCFFFFFYFFSWLPDVCDLCATKIGFGTNCQTNIWNMSENGSSSVIGNHSKAILFHEWLLNWKQNA